MCQGCKTLIKTIDGRRSWGHRCLEQNLKFMVDYQEKAMHIVDANNT